MVALGVDFGTSHTVAVARWPDGRARPLLFDGSPLLPSAVSLDESGLVVGRDAMHSARRAPESFEPNPKRRIDEGSVLLGERDVAVQAMLTAVFRRVLAEFTRTAGGAPTAVTVTHPAGWASTRRKALMDAVRAAGLPDAVLVPEPVAAATYFVRVLRHMVPVGSAVVVYDLGAGTFDGSVVARTAAGFEVLAVGGRDDLGGLDFDEIVLNLIGRILPPEDWQRVTADPRAGRQLREEAREAKERLSRTASVTVMVPLLDVDVQLTREEFEAAARPLVERSVRVLAETLRLSRLTPDRIAGIFLVGGASQLPLVATELHREFGRPPVMIEQPEMVVAEGSVLVGPPVPAPTKRPTAALALPAASSPSTAPSGSAPPGTASLSGPLSALSGSARSGAASAASGALSAPSVSAPPVSPGPVSPGFAAPAPISPMPPTSPGLGGVVPSSPMPVPSPPPRRAAPGPYGGYPPRPMHPPPVYYPPPPPQVVYYPAYALPPMFVPPPPRRKGPWSIRWPAGFMTLYAVLLYILTAGLLLVYVLSEPSDTNGLDWDKLKNDSLETAILCVVLATLLVHGARRLRRPMGGHLWYPLALCLILGAFGLAYARYGWVAQLVAVVFLGSVAMLVLPGSRRWLRRPPKPPSRRSLDPEPDPPQPAAG
jgi:actin-like ATPase involved in cell morphogenesis